MNILEKLLLDGYIDVNGSTELHKITSGASKTNFHRVVHPMLYDKYTNASSEEERKEIKDNTPQISRSDYSSATVTMFLERMESNDYKITIGETSRIGFVFYNENKKVLFSVSNTQLMLHLTLLAESLGVPASRLNLRHLAKEIMKDLTFKVKLIDLKNNS